MAYLALVSAVEGRRAGLAATAGVALGLAVVGVAAALGLAALINNSPSAYAVLRWAGVAYFLWLAVEAWFGVREVSPERVVPDGEVTRHFVRGLVINILNPKAGLFFVAVLPGFLDPAGNLARQTLVLTGLYVAVATAVHLTLVALAGAARDWMADTRRERLARRVFALLLAGLAAWFLFATGA